MLKKLRKHLRQKRLAAAMALALALAYPASPAQAVITSTVMVTTARTISEDIAITSNEYALYSFTAGGRASMNGLSITVSPPTWNNVYAAWATNSGQIFLTNVTVATHGPTSGNYGLYADSDGKITMAGGSITTDGAAGHGAVAGNGGTITLTNTAINVTGGGSFALLANGGTITASVDGQNMYGSGGLMATAGTGTVNLTASGNSRLTGLIATGGGTVNLTLNGNAAWTSPSFGSPSLTNLTLNGGSMIFSTPSGGFRMLNILGKLGGTGGTLNTFVNLNTGWGDLVRITGTASGSHNLAVTILGGYPTDLYRVYRVVDVNNALANTATFSGGSDVRAYRYGLAKGSSLSAAYSGLVAGGEGDYYLYNTFTPSSPASAALGTSAADSVIWYGEMNEIRKRLGDLRQGAGSGDFWARTYAGKFRVTPGPGQDFTQTLYGLELGRDAQAAFEGGKRHLGWVIGGGWADRSFGHGGDGRTDSAYLGAYASWIKDDGAYWDVVAKQNWYSHRFDTPLLGGASDSAAYDTSGIGLSVETGKRIEKGDGYFIEPQVELAALWTKGKNYSTAGGLAVNARAETSLQLRVGGIAGKKTAQADGGSRQLYGKLAWVHELAGENRTTVDGVSFASSLKGGRLVAGVGYAEDNAKRQLYLDVETAWGQKTDVPWAVNLGCRWKF